MALIIFPGGAEVKASASQVLSLGQEDPLEKEMVTHSSILAVQRGCDIWCLLNSIIQNHLKCELLLLKIENVLSTYLFYETQETESGGVWQCPWSVIMNMSPHVQQDNIRQRISKAKSVLRCSLVYTYYLGDIYRNSVAEISFFCYDIGVSL